jgi:hypothetical protein
MPSDTCSKGKVAVRGDFDSSDAQHLSPSPPRTSEAALTSTVFDLDLPELDNQLRTIERELVMQRETTSDMLDLIRDLRDSFNSLRTDVANTKSTAQPATKIPKPTPGLTKSSTAQPPAPACSHAKPGVPQDFDSDCEKGRAFFNSCHIYIRNCASEFIDDQAKIMWALSYMKSRCAAKFVECVLRYEDRMLTEKFANWDEFRVQFTSEFCPEDKATRAHVKLEGLRYFQDKWTVLSAFVLIGRCRRENEDEERASRDNG